MSNLVKNQFREISVTFPGTTERLLVKKNNLNDIQLLLETLAGHQASHLASSKEASNIIQWDITTIIKSVKIPEDFPRVHLKNLTSEINRLHQDGGVVVPIVTGELHLNPTTNRQVTSPIYDALIYIFTMTDERFRQSYFESLIGCYFEKLVNELRKTEGDVASKFTEFHRDLLVRLFLPVVKITVQDSLLEQTPTELVSNIGRYFKTPLLNQEDLYVVLRNKLGSDDYRLLQYGLRRLGETNGHVAQYYHLDVDFETANQQNKVTFFTKFMIPPEQSLEEFVKCGLAPREHFFYSTLMPAFRRNGLDDLLGFCPRCYLSRVAWVMVLDDLTQRGFAASTPNRTLDYPELRCVVSALAKFHACTIIYEEKTGRSLYDDHKEHLEDLMFDERNPLASIFKNGLAKTKYLFKLCPDLTGSRSLSETDVNDGLDAMFQSVCSKLKRNDKYRNVVCHGDLYMANLLLKTDKTSTILVDFQSVRYCPPTTDLAFLIYNASTKETRNKYLGRLIREYYDDLTRNLDGFGLDSRSVFPRDEFLDGFEFARSSALITALLYGQITHQDPHFREQLFQDAENHKYYLYDNCEELVDLGWRAERYRIILRGLVEDSVDLIARKNI